MRFQVVRQKESDLKRGEGDSQNHQSQFIIKMIDEFVLMAEVTKDNLEKDPIALQQIYRKIAKEMRIT